MKGSDIADWAAPLARLNSILISTNRWRGEIPPEVLSSGWCGAPAASEEDIGRVESRIGLRLPPSYRSFLRVSNGWRPFNSFIERLLPVQEIERYETADPEDSILIQSTYKEDNLTDEQYLDYEAPHHNSGLRTRYYPSSFMVGTKWKTGGGELVLLNPNIVPAEGEWETIFFANWIPGNQRFRSFYDFVLQSINDLEMIEKSQQPPGGV